MVDSFIISDKRIIEKLVEVNYKCMAMKVKHG